MFDWRKDYFNREMDTSLISEYPWLHYRPRKKTALELAGQFKANHFNRIIYSNKKEISRWEHFQIHSRQWLTNLRTSLVLEIKHLSKLRNLKLKSKRVLLKIKEFLTVLSLALEDILQDDQQQHRNYTSLKMAISTGVGPISTTVLDQLDDSELARERTHYELTHFCSDCGQSLYKRWYSPNQDLHYICHLIG